MLRIEKKSPLSQIGLSVPQDPDSGQNCGKANSWDMSVFITLYHPEITWSQREDSPETQ